MIYSGVCLLLLYFFIPETYALVLLQRKAREFRKTDPIGNKDVYAEHERGDWSLKGVMRRTVLRPVEMVLREKILVFVTIYLSFVYGVLYSRKCFRFLPLFQLNHILVVFETLPIVFVVRRHFSVAHLGLMYIGMFCAPAERINLNYFQSCLRRDSPGRCNLCLASKERGRARGEMGGFPTSREPANWCYDRWSPSGDRLLLARLDRRVQSYPLVCSDALDNLYWLCGQLGVRLVLGKLPTFACESSDAYPASRVT